MLTHLKVLVGHLLGHFVDVRMLLLQPVKLLLSLLDQVVQLFLFLETLLKFAVNVLLPFDNLILKPVLIVVGVVWPASLEHDAILADAFGQVVSPRVGTQLLQV